MVVARGQQRLAREPERRMPTVLSEEDMVAEVVPSAQGDQLKTQELKTKVRKEVIEWSFGVVRLLEQCLSCKVVKFQVVVVVVISFLEGAASSANGKNMSRLSVAAKRKRGARVPEVQCPSLFTR